MSQKRKFFKRAARHKQQPLPLGADTQDFLEQLIAWTLTGIAGAPEIQSAGKPVTPASYAPETLEGLCGATQHMMRTQIRKMEFGTPLSFALQTLPAPYTFSHVALVLECADGLILLDPTFRQFECARPDAPPALLAQSKTGREVLDSLVNKGFFVLTEERASTYLSAFANGDNPFSTAAEALSYFENPPDSDMNRWFMPGHPGAGKLKR